MSERERAERVYLRLTGSLSFIICVIRCVGCLGGVVGCCGDWFVDDLPEDWRSSPLRDLEMSWKVRASDSNASVWW